MAQYDGSIRINTLLNTRDFVSSFRQLGNSIRGLLGTLGLGLGIAGLVALGKQAIETASDIQEVQNVVDTAFGSMSYKMEQFAKTSVKQFGISQLSAKQLGSTFMAMGKSMVGDMETASNMALNLTARAADMASFYNKSVQETSTALKSIYTGETESLKEYGVVMTQVNLQEFAYRQGINKKISAMNQAEKVQLQYAYVMEQTSLAAGDFARTSDSWANQTRILSEQFKELLSVLGGGLITVLTPVVKFLNTILSMLIAIAKQIGAILSKLFGISIPVADSGKFADDLSAAAGGAEELTEGMDAAGKAAEKAGKAAKGALAPFDDLNVLAKETGSGGAAGSVGIGGGFEMPDLELEDTEVEEVDALSSATDNLIDRMQPLFDWFIRLKDLFKEGFFDGLGESWNERISDIQQSAGNIIKILMDIFTDPSVVSAAQTMIEDVVYAMGQALGAVTSIGITMGQNLVGGIDMYLYDNSDFLKERLTSIFDISGDIALLIGEALNTMAYIFEPFGSLVGQQVTANIIGMFANTTLSLVELAGKFGRDLLSAIITPISENKEGLRTAFLELLSVAYDVSGTVLEAINHTFSKINEIYDQYFAPFFDSITNGLSELLAQFLEFWNGYMQPILNSWAESFDTLWAEHIQPMIDNFLEMIGVLVEALTVFWEEILQPILSWAMEVLAPTIADACDIIFSQVENVIKMMTTYIEGIIDVVKGVINILLGIATGDWKRVWTGFSDVVEGIWKKIKSIINGIIGAIEAMANGVVAGINTVIRALNSLNFTFPDWIPGFGGEKFDLGLSEIDKVSIPRLATGAVIRGGNPFMAVLGDQPAGRTNIEAPLSTIEQALDNVMDKRGGYGGERVPVTINLNYDGETFARLSIPDILSELARQGYDVSILGAN